MKQALRRSLIAATIGLTACAVTSTPAPTKAERQGSAADRSAASPVKPAIEANVASLDYDALDARAELEIKRVAQSGFLWLNTESYLAAARAARKAGNADEALKLARKALEEALLAQRQAAESAAMKPDYTYRR